MAFQRQFELSFQIVLVMVMLPEPSLFLAFDGNPVTAALGRGQDKGRNMENGKWENCQRSTYNGEKVR